MGGEKVRILEGSMTDSRTGMEKMLEENEILKKEVAKAIKYSNRIVDFAAIELSQRSEFTKQHWVEKLTRAAKENTK